MKKKKKKKSRQYFCSACIQDPWLIKISQLGKVGSSNPSCIPFPSKFCEGGESATPGGYKVEALSPELTIPQNQLCLPHACLVKPKIIHSCLLSSIKALLNIHQSLNFQTLYLKKNCINIFVYFKIDMFDFNQFLHNFFKSNFQ